MENYSYNETWTWYITFSGLNKNTAQLCVKQPAHQPDQALILSGWNQPIDTYKSSQFLELKKLDIAQVSRTNRFELSEPSKVPGIRAHGSKKSDFDYFLQSHQLTI